jgi:hypothetical protein
VDESSSNEQARSKKSPTSPSNPMAVWSPSAAQVPSERADCSSLATRPAACQTAASVEGTMVGVASLTEPIGGDTVWSLAFRLHPDGTLDPSFGRRGVKVLSPLR